MRDPKTTPMPGDVWKHPHMDGRVKIASVGRFTMRYRISGRGNERFLMSLSNWPDFAEHSEIIKRGDDGIAGDPA